MRDTSLQPRTPSFRPEISQKNTDENCHFPIIYDIISVDISKSYKYLRWRKEWQQNQLNSPKQIKTKEKAGEPIPPSRMSAVIREALERIDENLDQMKDPSEHWKKIRKVLKKKDKDKILEIALENYYNSEELKPYQAELIKLQKHMERTGKKMIILFDGRDASGKGGTIRRVTRYMNEKHYRVVALGKPSQIQRTELHMKRYIEQFPRSGEIVLFDRSWYNRAMVEPVMGFCTKEQYKRFMNKVTTYERNFIDDGKTVLLKLYFSVSKEEQARRFERRKNDPLRQWKLSEVDLQAQESLGRVHGDEIPAAEKNPYQIFQMVRCQIRRQAQGQAQHHQAHPELHQVRRAQPDP